MITEHRILVGDARIKLADLADASVSCAITSTPYYGLRDYLCDDQIGQEETPEEFVSSLVAVFREVRRVLHPTGTLWLNIGDSYASSAKNRTEQQATSGTTLTGKLDGQLAILKQKNKVTGDLKAKDLIGVPWMLAFALRADGWWLRQCMPWLKRNAMPESTRDRPTNSVEQVFLFSKSASYFYDYAAVLRTMAESSGPRLAQDSERANGGAKTNGAMKAVRGDKQRGHSRRHAGFNDRWDAMDRDEQCGSRAWRNSDLFFESLTYPHGVVGTDEEMVAFDIPTSGYKEAHFATYPPRLVIPMIQAGSSERGVCPKCMAPWERITEQTQLIRERPNDYTKRTGEEGTGNSCANSVAGVEVKTLGWEPTCQCGEQPQPAIILDPFLGSGTTAQMARSLGRSSVGIELNPAYADLARKRTASLVYGDKTKPVESSDGQQLLF